MPEPSSQTLRTMLTAAFSDEELSTFCYDHFGAVYQQFAVGMAKTDKVQRLIAHCDNHGEQQRLLTLLRQERPALFRARVFISYKRHTQPDEPLALALHAALQQAGHHVFIDQQMWPGTEWMTELARQIEQSDYMIALLSKEAVNSEMVAEETVHACNHWQQQGKPRILPIRIAYREPLPYQLRDYLDPFQYIEWHTPADEPRIIETMLAAIANWSLLPPAPPMQQSTDTATTFSPPPPAADPAFIESLPAPGGAVRTLSDLYIERKGDHQLRRELNKTHGTTTTIKAPRQCGKSSLLIRGIAQARQQQCKVVHMDLQRTIDEELHSLESFLRSFALNIVRCLRLDPAEVERAWNTPYSTTDKLTSLMEDYILLANEQRMVLAIDEADRLLPISFGSGFFGLMRAWHNSRTINDLWEQLDIILVISTEPYLLIADINQSPFNVGEEIVLRDFDEAQVRELNQRYHAPLREHELPALMELLNGHPYLVQRALYTLVTQQQSWAQLAERAVAADSPFAAHLRRYQWLLREQELLKKALRQVIARGSCPDEESFHRLWRAGLISGANSTTCRCRCKLYADYLGERL